MRPQQETSFCSFFIIISVILSNVSSVTSYRSDDPVMWTGKWFPEKPASLTHQHQNDVSKKNNTAPMGVLNSNCDDGKTNLSVDWDGSFDDYICMNPRNRFLPNPSSHSIIEYENIPKIYTAPHFCMQRSIEYKSPLPTFGPHRPIWPKYGEYKFVPKQRWIHSLEHGGIVALYHPCADLREIKLLKKLVKNCIRRHIISPSSELTHEQPFALLAWGVRFTMPIIDPNKVRHFIKENALKGPEKLADEGQYEFLLIKEAKIVSDYEDSTLCPEATSYQTSASSIK